METVIVKSQTEIFLMTADVVDNVNSTSKDYLYLRLVKQGNNPVNESDFNMIPQSPSNQVTMNVLISGISQVEVAFELEHSQGGDDVLIDNFGNLYHKVKQL